MGLWNKDKKKTMENYISSTFNYCPICNTTNPNWLYEHERFLQDRKIIFTCRECGCTLSCTYGDIQEVSSNGVAKWLNANDYNAFAKSVYGKKKNTLYVQVKNMGNSDKSNLYEQREYTVDELKDILIKKLNV